MFRVETFYSKPYKDAVHFYKTVRFIFKAQVKLFEEDEREEASVTLLVGYLRGKAKKWYKRNYPDKDKETLKDLTNALCLRFPK